LLCVMEIKYDKSNYVEDYLSQQISPEEAKDLLAIALYNKGILSQSQAGDLVGKTIREFHSILLKYGYPISGETSDEDIEILKKSLLK
jgi:predicted HTH domain antitoxin